MLRALAGCIVGMNFVNGRRSIPMKHLSMSQQEQVLLASDILVSIHNITLRSLPSSQLARLSVRTNDNERVPQTMDHVSQKVLCTRTHFIAAIVVFTVFVTIKGAGSEAGIVVTKEWETASPLNKA